MFTREAINKLIPPLRLKYKAGFATNAEEHRKKIMARGLPKVKPIADVDKIVLVASGKGGVGKSTTAVNVAVALKSLHPSKNIGLLDADVFGPSIPLMMNLNQSPLLNKENLMEPLVNYGVKCMSMGFLIGEESALIWRGLMVMQALEKLLRQVAWGPTDCLIVDTPPGTGDTHLSLIQNIPVNGVVLVTTPQNAALQVMRRGITMFKKMNVPIVGIVENMSSVRCEKCSNDVRLFGPDIARFACENGVEVLQQVPLLQEITQNTDEGVPMVIARPESAVSASYKSIGEKVMQFLEKSEQVNTSQ